MKKIRNYLRQIGELRRRTPSRPGYGQMLSWFPEWSRSFHEGASPLSCRLPWITFGAIDAIRAAVQPHWRVFEYGAGGSTLFLAGLAGAVISIEHDRAWAEAVREALASAGASNANVRWIPPQPINELCPPDPADAEAYGTADEVLRNFSFKHYVESIDDEPDESLDLVLIDGRARPSCLRHALAKVRAGGMIVLDNSDRPYYRAAMDLADQHFCRVDHDGPVPCLREFSRTSIWTKGGIA